MENTKENKLKFYALYHGQDVEVERNKSGFIECIKLKPLSSIDDETAVEVARIVKGRYGAKEGHSIIEYILNEEYPNCLYNNEGIQLYFYHIQEIFDFLRSKGYLTSFHDLTPEMIVEYGWCKLKTE